MAATLSGPSRSFENKSSPASICPPNAMPSTRTSGTVVALLMAVLRPHAAHAEGPSVMPKWTGRVPSKKYNSSAGLAPVPDVKHIVVYNATRNGKPNPFGTYNHGPMVTAANGTLLMSWYNAPRDEPYFKRSVFAYSRDGGDSWSEPDVLFTNLTMHGEENGPWTTLNGRLYTQSGSEDAGLHLETIISVMRRVYVPAEGEDDAKPTLGPVFWLNRTVPQGFEQYGFKTYLEMDATTRRDAEQYLASTVRTLFRAPDQDHGGLGSEMKYNERSVYLVPGTRTVMNLVRGPDKQLTAVTCELPAPKDTLPPAEAFSMTLFSCRAGVGDRFLALTELLASGFDNKSDPRVCEWSDPVLSSIPDARSRTCAGPLDGQGSGIYLVGAQNPEGRDPVTLAIAQDGINFDRQWAVRWGAPPVRYPGLAKGPGFQYPGAAVFNGNMYVTYSVGKEDIAVTRFPLRSVSPS